MAWLAYPSDSTRVRSGSIARPPGLDAEHKVEFEEAFERTPRVFIALNGLEIEANQELDTKVMAFDLHAQSFRWVNFAPPKASVWMDWIAFG